MNKIVYIGFAFHHHKGTHAGYHQIKEYLSYDYEIDIQDFIDRCSVNPKSFISKIKRKIMRLAFGFPVFPWFILKCMWMAIAKGHLTFHFIYGENSLEAFPLRHIRNCKVVVTLHQPHEWFLQNDGWKDKLMKIDSIILVSKTEVEDFKKITHENNVFFFPHGICADFYRPNGENHDKKLVLMVGNWLRDFVFASKVFTKLENFDSGIRAVVVTNQNNAKYFKENKNVEVLSGITDEALRELYRKTSCLFLPLKRYTANNALLEAGAVGDNILIASNNADNSYIPNEFLSICPLDIDTAFEEIKTMLGKDGNIRLSKFVHDNYSWNIVADNIKRYIEDM